MDDHTESQSYAVYILRCADGTLYTGITNDLAHRLAAHNAGTGAKYTRGRGPVTLLYRELCPDRSAASRREREIKLLSRAEKLALIAGAQETGRRKEREAAETRET